MYRATHKGILHNRVLAMVRKIRRRWRTRIAIRGMAIVLGAGLLAFLLSVFGLEVSRFSASSVVVFRVILWVAGAGLVARFLIWPLARRVSDEQAALYLEENEPSLEAAVLAALETQSGSDQASESLERKLVESALERAADVDFGRRIEQKGLYRASGALAAMALGSLALLLLGPSQLRNGAAALLLPTRDAGTVNPYSVSVSPGDVTIARGSDQLVTAELQGFQTDDVQIFFRGESSDAFDQLSMLMDGSEGFELLLLSLDENTDYFVESGGIRSATHRIEVADLPYVEHLELEYRFPAYSGLPSRKVEFGGDIAALRGTVVRLRVFPTMLTPGGQLLIDGEPVELTDEGDGTWTASLTVEREGYYEVALARAGGELVSASPQYTIDVLSDQPPSVSFSKPGRDENATPIEEFYVEAKADDDYGVSELLFMYSVNGGAEDTVRLFDDRPTPEVTAGHTLFLEEFGLESGDLIAYYAQVEDSNPATDSRTAKSDIYFVTIRPFGLEFRQAEQGGGGGGGGGGQEERALSELQEQVVAATYNLVRDRELYSESEFRENLVSVRLAQGRAREQVAGLLQRLTSRGLGGDSEFEKISELLSQAVVEMEAAEEVLADGELQEAISPELRALLQLQKAEENYEFEVSQGQQGGGGGGGGGARADDLADLFELELDKLQNQYETVERGERQQAGDQLEETMEALKELARRQQQQAERQRRASAQQGGASGGASAQNQRDLAAETEEAARRLERLARETNDQQLMDASRRLQEAAGDMRRAAAAAGSAATADANSALDRLEDVQRRLERDRIDRLRSDVEETQRRAEDLMREQRDMEADMNRLGEASGGPGTEAGRRLFERKEAMNDEAADLEREIDRLASDARADQRDASERLREASNTIRDDKLKERIRYSRGLIGSQDGEYTNEFEAETTRIVEELAQELEEAIDAIGENQEGRLAEALDRARDLSRGAESLSRRLGERGAQGQDQQNPGGQGDQGQQGQGQQDPGGQGDQGQQGGQQGQGQQDQQGQQGQGQQGGQQGGQSGADGQNQGGFGGGGDYANTRGGRLTQGDIRQFRSEARQRVQEAIELQRILEEEDLNQQQLGEVIGALRELDRENAYLDLAELNRLQSQIVEGLRQLEFGLRRELEGEGKDRVFVSGSDEVPTGFRRLVEEYYRALSRTPSN